MEGVVASGEGDCFDSSAQLQHQLEVSEGQFGQVDQLVALFLLVAANHTVFLFILIVSALFYTLLAVDLLQLLHVDLLGFEKIDLVFLTQLFLLLQHFQPHLFLFIDYFLISFHNALIALLLIAQ